MIHSILHISHKRSPFGIIISRLEWAINLRFCLNFSHSNIFSWVRGSMKMKCIGTTPFSLKKVRKIPNKISYIYISHRKRIELPIKSKHGPFYVYIKLRSEASMAHSFWKLPHIMNILNTSYFRIMCSRSTYFEIFPTKDQWVWNNLWYVSQKK